jgi:flagellar motor switch protein FliG
MTQLPPSLRKAAVLISALDDGAADALLSQMSHEDAAKVRSALVELDEIPADEQQQVLADFLAQQGAPAVAPEVTGDVELDLDPHLEAAAARSHPVEAASALLPEPANRESPFSFLKDVEPNAIAAVLNREHPQTVAVVVANLPPQHAASVLQKLPAALATDALERIASLDALAPEVQTDLARELRRQLAPHLKSPEAACASFAHLTAVLEAMEDQQRRRVVSRLGARNRNLAHRLGLAPAAETRPSQHNRVVALRYRLDSDVPMAAAANPRRTDDSWLTFDDFALLDDAGLRAVFAAADAEMALVALTGAEPRLIARIERKLPPREAAELRRRLEHPGPIRLRDIEHARTAMAAVASRLAHEGTIRLPPGVGFAAAV